MTGSSRSLMLSHSDSALVAALPAGPVPSGLVEMVDRSLGNETGKAASDPSSALDGGSVPHSLLEEIEAAMIRPTSQGTAHENVNTVLSLDGGTPPQWLIRDVEGG